MSISAKDVAQLRSTTGCGMMDCKKALEESQGDVEKAHEILRKKGAAKAAKKADRDINEGVVASYIHSTKKVGTMVKLACETDFVARNEEFQALAYEIAMHVAAANPDYLDPESVPEQIIEKEKEIYREQLLKEGKPENMLDKIMEGKIKKFYEDVCLVKQPFIKDTDKSIEQLLQEGIIKVGENIKILDFVRFEI